MRFLPGFLLLAEWRPWMPGLLASWPGRYKGIMAAPRPCPRVLGRHAGARGDEIIPAFQRRVPVGNSKAGRLCGEVDCDDGGDVGDRELISRNKSHIAKPC